MIYVTTSDTLEYKRKNMIRCNMELYHFVITTNSRISRKIAKKADRISSTFLSNEEKKKLLINLGNHRSTYVCMLCARCMIMTNLIG